MPYKYKEDKDMWYRDNKKRILANHGTEEYKKHRSEIRKKHGRKVRAKVLSIYGKKCNCCDEKNIRFMTIDHVNNDGKEERERLNYSGGRIFYAWLIKQPYQPDRYQTLCFNCNLGKRVNEGICPHII